MRLLDLIKSVMADVPLAAIHYLHHYREERKTKYPGVPIKPFTNWFTHKDWMLSERKRFLRKEHNRKVLAKVKLQEQRA